MFGRQGKETQPGNDPRLLVNIFGVKKMNLEDIADEVELKFQQMVNDLVEQQVKAIVTKGNPALTEFVERSPELQKGIRDYFERHAATTVGNRLRCGCYEGTQVDKIFEGIWTEQWDRAIADRIRGKVNDTINAIIKERLSKL